jgi:glycerol uptake facilitator-like aquaporin
MEKELRGYLAELIGTFAVVFLGAGAVCVNQAAIQTDKAQLAPGLIGIALAYGLAYAVALAVTLPHSSYGYLNPAVPLMFWVFKRLDGVKTTGLIFVQLLGAAIAGGMLQLIYTPEVLANARMGSPHLNVAAFGAAGLPMSVLLKGVALELGLTFILGMVIFGTSADPRVTRILGAWGKRLIGLWVGLILVVITLAAFPMTGAAVNPARWFGTVIWEMALDSLRARKPFGDHMVYWFGPIAGSLVAGVVYTMLIMPQESESTTSSGSPVGGSKVAAGAGAALFRSKK